LGFVVLDACVDDDVLGEAADGSEGWEETGEFLCISQYWMYESLRTKTS